MPSVRLDGLRKSFGERVGRRDISVEFRDGEMTSVLGPSGCGKTTMLNLIAGFIDPDGGTIRFGDRLIADAGARHRGAAEQARPRHGVPELRAVAASDVGENVAYGLKMHNVARAPNATRRSRRALQRVRLDAHRRPLSARALRRPAAARRARPRDRLFAADPAVRRAALQPRCAIARGDAGGAQGHPPRDRRHRDLRHPRPGRGDEPVRHASSSWGTGEILQVGSPRAAL